MSDKERQYKWMRVDTIYNLIVKFLLCHILHIRNGYFDLMLHIPIYVIICVTDIHRMNNLGYNYKFDI